MLALKFLSQVPIRTLVISRLRTILLFAGLVSLGAAPAALADTSISSNWAGYAAHRTGVHFRQVTGNWVQPNVSCAAPTPTYSAMWVGIGGFAETSNALEQIGTEVDCSHSGRPISSAWYELVPAPSVPIGMPVHIGDLMSASVILSPGHRVTMTLTDVTRHRSFHRTFVAPSIDDTAAEWILEAPSACVSNGACQTLTLADFGTAAFSLATAKATVGPVQPILSPLWDTTAITLAPTSPGRHFVGLTPRATPGGALPSVLSAAGSAFSVAYSTFGLHGTQPVLTTHRALDRLR